MVKIENGFFSKQLVKIKTDTIFDKLSHCKRKNTLIKIFWLTDNKILAAKVGLAPLTIELFEIRWC